MMDQIHTFRRDWRTSSSPVQWHVAWKWCRVTMTTLCDPPRVLIADDQPDLLDALRLLLKSEGIGMEAVTSPEAVETAVEHGTYDLLLMDLNYTSDTTSGREGIDLLARVQARDGL